MTSARSWTPSASNPRHPRPVGRRLDGGDVRRHPSQRTRALLIWGAMARWVATADHPWGLSREEAERLIEDVQDNWPSEWYIRGPGAGLGPDADDALVQFRHALRPGRRQPSRPPQPMSE